MRRFAPSVPDPRPIADINTTPLIDVMLVLLIMIILTVPMPTHKVAVDLPAQGRPAAAPPPVHRLDIDVAGRLFWDGAPLPDAALAAKLKSLRGDPAQPVLHMRTDAETPYVRFDETLAEVKRAGIEKLGFVGNERYATF